MDEFIRRSSWKANLEEENTTTAVDIHKGKMERALLQEILFSGNIWDMKSYLGYEIISGILNHIWDMKSKSYLGYEIISGILNHIWDIKS